MNRSGRLAVLLAQVERRHWVGLGASVALHLAVLLGLRQAPPPEPEPVSFEIALEAPKPEPLTRAKVKSRATKAKAKAAKPKKALAKRKPVKREPHTLEAEWRREAKPAKDAPRVALPDTRALGVEAPVVETATSGVPARKNPVSNNATDTPAGAGTGARIAASNTPAAPAQASHTPTTAQAPGAADMSEPGAASAAMASQAGPAGDPGIALAASTDLNRGFAAAPGLASGAQSTSSAEAAAGLAANGSGKNAGQGPGSLSASQSAGAGFNVASGNGAQSSSSLESPATAGGEPQGVRLTVSGTLSERANLPAGSGSLAAGPTSTESGRAAPSQAQSSGAALVSARAGGASATPASNPSRPAAGGASSSAKRALGQSGQPGANGAGGAKLAQSGAPGKSSANPSRRENARQGGAASERSTSQGDASGESKALLASSGQLGHTGTGVEYLGVKSSRRGPGTSQSGKTLALAPGEPGSSPNLAVTMQTLVAVPGARARGGGSGGKGAAMASDSNGTGGAYPGAALTRVGGADQARAGAAKLTLAAGPGGAPARPEGAPVGSEARGTMTGTVLAQAGAAATSAAREPARLQTAKVEEEKLIRPDSQAKPLDVLAPSTYCPLPLPGHSFPNNRPPKPDENVTTQPAYAQDNPSFIFPIQAWAGNIQGKAIVRVEVLPDGKPGRMWLKQSSGSGILDRDARSQLTLWHFIPARKNGQPVTAWIDVPVVYRLQDAKK